MRSLHLRAHAKVNLTLDVLARRADGYHEIRSLMARISLADDVRVARSRRWHVVVRPTVDAPRGEELSERAARELARRLGRDDGAAIAVRKRIPVAAGLGGGSSDAAHVLRALATLWQVEEELVREVAAAVGSDVPFFLDGALAEVGGRGERVRPLTGGPFLGVLAVPRCRISTAAAFARLTAGEWSGGGRTDELARLLRASEVTPARLRDLCGNDLDAVAVAMCPEIADVRARSPVPFFVSGSGPALFTIADDVRQANSIRKLLRRAGVRALAIEVAIVP